MLKRKLGTVILSFILVFSSAIPVKSAARCAFYGEISDFNFSVEFDKSSLDGNGLTAKIDGVNGGQARSVAFYLAHYSKSGKMKNISATKVSLTAGRNFSIAARIDTPDVAAGDCVKLLTWEKGALVPIEGAYTVGTPTLALKQRFSTEGKLSEESAKDGWKAASVIESGDTSYTPSLGDKLYGEIASGELHLFDGVGRTTDPQNGAGAICAYRSIPVFDCDFTIRFDLYAPTANGNNAYGGFTLSSGLANTVGNAENPAALQIRFSPQGGNMLQLNKYGSVAFNEGNFEAFLGSFTRFNQNNVLSFTLNVSPEKKKIKVTVSDGITEQSTVTGYNMSDPDYVKTVSWDSLRINMISFNTGIGGGGDMYIKSFAIYKEEIKKPAVYKEDLSGFGAGTKLEPGTEYPGWKVTPMMENPSSFSYTPNFGTDLFAEYAYVPDGTAKALRLYDNVGRTQDYTKGTGAVIAYRPLPDTERSYKVKFKMLVPGTVTASGLGGVSLGCGVNKGQGSSDAGPLAMQIRLVPRAPFVRFVTLQSQALNGGSSSEFIGAPLFSPGSVLSWEITVDNKSNVFDVAISEGEKTVRKSYAFLKSGSEDWSEHNVNTIEFNTGAGGSDEFYVWDFEIEKAGDTLPALLGPVRLESAQSAGYFLCHENFVGKFASKLSLIADSRFVERKGLADEKAVSFESVNYPGYYLYQNTDNTIALKKADSSTDFASRATFYKVRGLSDPIGVSYRSYLSSGLYLANSSPGAKMISPSNDDEMLSATFVPKSEAAPSLGERFDGGTLNTDIWAYNYAWGTSHNHSGIAAASQVSVRGGNLVLTATRVADNNWIKNHKGDTGYEDKMGPSTAPWRKFSHLTGVIHLPFQRMGFSGNCYIEGKFKLPSEYGYWPAFWLDGYYHWPPEIDIFEYLSDRNYLNVGIHRQVLEGESGSEVGSGYQVKSFISGSVYHTFAIDWTDTYICYYIDGKLVRTVTDSKMLANQKDMYLIINLGVGGWADEPTDTAVGSGAQLLCDYVKIIKY